MIGSKILVAMVCHEFGRAYIFFWPIILSTYAKYLCSLWALFLSPCATPICLGVGPNLNLSLSYGEPKARF